MNTRDFSMNNLDNGAGKLEDKFTTRVPSLYGNSNGPTHKKSIAKSQENLRMKSSRFSKV